MTKKTRSEADFWRSAFQNLRRTKCNRFFRQWNNPWNVLRNIKTKKSEVVKNSLAFITLLNIFAEFFNCVYLWIRKALNTAIVNSYTNAFSLKNYEV